MKKPDAGWRELEKLVAHIERHLGPKGARIRSPDRIPDKITGQSREVDVSVRYQIGSVYILITIECRDRVAVQDVTWIEHLVCKRDSIGASATVAVSSSEFSAPAIEKARRNGIEIRRLREISEDAIREWADRIHIMAIRGRFRIGTMRVRVKPTPRCQSPELHEDVKRGYAKGDVEFSFIRRTADGKLTSIGDLLRDAERAAGNRVYERAGADMTIDLPGKTSAAIAISSQFPSLFEDVPVGGPPVTKSRAWRFDPGEATVETEDGPAEVEYVEVELHIIQCAYPSQVGRLLAYENPERRVANVEERDVALGEGESVRVIISGGPAPSNGEEGAA